MSDVRKSDIILGRELLLEPFVRRHEKTFDEYHSTHANIPRTLIRQNQRNKTVEWSAPPDPIKNRLCLRWPQNRSKLIQNWPMESITPAESSRNPLQIPKFGHARNSKQSDNHLGHASSKGPRALLSTDDDGQLEFTIGETTSTTLTKDETVRSIPESLRYERRARSPCRIQRRFQTLDALDESVVKPRSATTRANLSSTIVEHLYRWHRIWDMPRIPIRSKKAP